MHDLKKSEKQCIYEENNRGIITYHTLYCKGVGTGVGSGANQPALVPQLHLSVMSECGQVASPVPPFFIYAVGMKWYLSQG